MTGLGWRGRAQTKTRASAARTRQKGPHQSQQTIGAVARGSPHRKIDKSQTRGKLSLCCVVLRPDLDLTFCDSDDTRRQSTESAYWPPDDNSDDGNDSFYEVTTCQRKNIILFLYSAIATRSSPAPQHNNPAHRDTSPIRRCPPWTTSASISTMRSSIT